MKAIFAMLAGYNRWANERLYKAAGALTREQYHEHRGAFLGSLNGTLNHLLVGDRIWMRRFTGEGPQPKALDEILLDDIADLARARAAEDDWIIAYINGLNEEALAAPFTYHRMIIPDEVTQPLTPVLIHFFNHQIHHRGQAHCLLTEITGEAPSLDLVVYQRASGAGMT
ncbi:DinB family protein [Breoghania sp.]|uniref:DinB family protein n=1 Tax=Breoghania sp. TaxID=2065378 RepID=UPI00262116CA|nr:DinB family protein [Breoghania sp.]MDJ0929644.1 DinB family protein [Breoghania sp.]